MGRNLPRFLVSHPPPTVALYAEGVGRNRIVLEEIAKIAEVALYAEGVGRNDSKQLQKLNPFSRPLRGGRG